MPTQQCMTALQEANDIRFERAQLKREINEGKVTVADVLETEPYFCDSMRVLELLCAQKRWGNVRAWKAMKQAGLGWTCKIGSVTKRQRNALLGILGEQ